MNSLIFPAACRSPSQYTPHPGSHTPYLSPCTSAIEGHPTSPSDVDLGFVFEPYDLRALLAGTRDVLFPRVREVLGSDLASRHVYLLRALLRSDFNPVVNGRLHYGTAMRLKQQVCHAVTLRNFHTSDSHTNQFTRGSVENENFLPCNPSHPLTILGSSRLCYGHR